MRRISCEAIFEWFKEENFNKQTIIKSLICFFCASLLLACGGYSDPAVMVKEQATNQNNEPVSFQQKDTDTALRYQLQCLTCHGSESLYPDHQLIQEGWAMASALAVAIADHPPLASGQILDCNDECAAEIAKHMLEELRLPILYVNRGQDIYIQQCAACHGANGEGGSGGPLTPDTCNSCQTLPGLIERNANTMPPHQPALCIGDCAEQTARYIKAGYIEVSPQDNLNDTQDVPVAPEPNDTPPQEPIDPDSPVAPPVQLPPIQIIPPQEPVDPDSPVVPPIEVPPELPPEQTPPDSPVVDDLLSCNASSKTRVFTDTVYEYTLVPQCEFCHAGPFASNTLFKMSEVISENYDLFRAVADAKYDFNNLPLLLAKAINVSGTHGGGLIFFQDGNDYNAVSTMIDLVRDDSGLCEDKFRLLYEIYQLPYPSLSNSL